MSNQKTALVTGANRGIGHAIAKGLAEQGLDVIVGARKKADADAAAAEIGARAVQIDVSDEASIESALEETGPIDVLVNNAGVLSTDPLLENPQAFDEALAVMLKGPYELIRRVAPGMAERGYGRIVNVSSEWGSFNSGLAGPGPYGLAKAALNGLTLAAARDLPETVKLNSMCPGWVRTRMGGESATKTPEEGADTGIWLATLPEDGPTGGFFQDRKPLAW
ncbi:SDR family NAD(P)-dependent oxidoreductase [Hyphobacterium sp.]|uniref:SDR family NAD(P)-dependent oxidoreductase n=1 Tax=Hyphobacterium sp. TaxID=2004662 RepID=UPI003BA8547F